MEKNIVNKVNIYVEKLNEDIILPEYSNKGDAGMDIRASKDIIILPGETKLVPTGIKLSIPEGYQIEVRPRSGLSLNTPLRISNAPGTIDSGYKDEIGIIVSNTSPVIILNSKEDPLTKEITYTLPSYSKDKLYTLEDKGNKYGGYLIKKNDRIAQIVLTKYSEINFTLVKENSISNMGNNRGGGFGHSGII